jgi:hypothetical protein
MNKLNLQKTIIRISAIGIIVVLVIVVSSSIFYIYKAKKPKTLKDYFGYFGLYDKTLTLYEDSTFNYSYMGCSQLNGNINGVWKIEGGILKLYPKEKDKTLDEKFIIHENTLTTIEKDSVVFTLRKNLENVKELFDYCGIIGNYIKSLTLYDDSTFVFNYGLSNTPNAYIIGNWKIDNEILKLSTKEIDKALELNYLIKGNTLTKIGKDSVEFTLCKYWKSPI